MRIVNFLAIVFSLSVLVLVSACNIERDKKKDNVNRSVSENTNEEDNASDLSGKVLLDLKYVCSVQYSNLDYLEEYTYSKNEFTYWIHCNDLNYISYFEIFGADVPADLAECVNGKTVIISFNRKLKFLFHDNSLHGWTEYESYYHGRPVFQRKYENDMLHIYVTDKIALIDNEFYDNDLSNFNLDGDVPYDFAYYKTKGQVQCLD